MVLHEPSASLFCARGAFSALDYRRVVSSEKKVAASTKVSAGPGVVNSVSMNGCPVGIYECVAYVIVTMRAGERVVQRDKTLEERFVVPYNTEGLCA